MRICGLMVLVIGAIGIAGCGFGDNVEAYPGTWTWTAGSNLSIDCGGDDLGGTLNGSLSISEGSSSDLVMNWDPCTWQFDVDGDKANLNSGQNCTYTNDGISFDEKWSTMMLTESGGSLDVSGSGTLDLSDSSGSANCTTSVAGSLDKL